MKTLALLFALSFYILAMPTHSTTFNPIRLPTADEALASDFPVLDTDGDEVRAGSTYYVTSFIWGAGGGGVKLARLNQKSQCPSDVIQSTNSFDLGDPIAFTPVGSTNNTVVLPSAYQAISFDVATNKLCVDKQSWKVEYDRRSGQYFLKAGETDANLSNFFKIQSVQQSLSAYKLTFCPVEDKCYNVGRNYDEERRAMRLVLSDNPFIVVFKKVDAY